LARINLQANHSFSRLRRIKKTGPLFMVHCAHIFAADAVFFCCHRLSFLHEVYNGYEIPHAISAGKLSGLFQMAMQFADVFTEAVHAESICLYKIPQ
jgi:hypothetical protein